MSLKMTKRMYIFLKHLALLSLIVIFDYSTEVLLHQIKMN